MTVSSSVILAVLLDCWLGEPDRYHPLIGFGKLAGRLERRLYFSGHSATRQFMVGLLALFMALLPLLTIVRMLLPLPLLETILPPLLLYLCIAADSLKSHAITVLQALQTEDLSEARMAVARIVSRETEHMTADDVRKATLESVLENGADAVFAPLFWFVLAGPAGALMYRLSNTLDAMWGYKAPRYLYFGRAAARCDDLLNWIPARLTALSYALLGNTRLALRCWRQQACLLDSPNAGPVMTAGAGALNVQLGGPARYHGQLKSKIHFGGERPTQNQDILRANRLIDKTLWLWLIIILIGDFLA